MKKRGQITIFLILGVVLLLVFFLILYLFSSLTSSKLNEEKKKVIMGVLEASAINYYAEICVQDALKKGLKLIGEQGGVLYLDQGGKIDRGSDYVDDGGDNVSFGIVLGELSNPDRAAYPCDCFYFSSSCEGPDYCKYPQGRVNLGKKKLLPQSGAFSLKNSLETFIELDTQKCVGDLISNQSSIYGFSPGKPEAKLILSSTATAVRVNYPLNVTIGDNSLTQFLYWKARENVRLKTIYRVVEDLVLKDVNYVDFKLRLVDGNLFNQSFKGEPNLFLGKGFSFKKKQYGENDVFIINDTASKIDGQPYIFKTARQNRPPALEWINRNYSLSDLYDYLVIEGEKINITAQAEDPDEDIIKYEFSGDLVSAFNGNSFVYQTSSSDLGYTNITVKVGDYVLKDWQVVRVLVDKLLKANFTVKSIYPRINGISIEDPIIWNGSSSTKSLDPNVDYTYVWHTLLYNETEYDCLTLPGKKDCLLKGVVFDIVKIKDQLKKDLGEKRIVTFTLEAFTYYNGRKQEDTNSTDIFVNECIPYRNPSSPAYPYHKTSNPFFGDHTCCLDDSTYAPNTTLCYSEEKNVSQGANFKQITKRYCSGDRGNICSGKLEIKNICQKTGVPTNCQNQEGYGLVNGGWCYGNGGCEKFCSSEIVDKNTNNQTDSGDGCGCGFLGSKPCDSDFDGIFEGNCTWSGQCV